MKVEEIDNLIKDDVFYTELTNPDYPEIVTKVYKSNNGHVNGVQYEHTWKNSYGLFRKKEYMSRTELLEHDVELITGNCYRWGNRYVYKN